jgi:hypothetical protein
MGGRTVGFACFGLALAPGLQSKVNPARDRGVCLSAIGQCLKVQYNALAAPIPPHLAALITQLETQEQE